MTWVFTILSLIAMCFNSFVLYQMIKMSKQDTFEADSLAEKIYMMLEDQDIFCIMVPNGKFIDVKDGYEEKVICQIPLKLPRRGTTKYLMVEKNCLNQVQNYLNGVKNA
jgi:hypothetical protein